MDRKDLKPTLLLALFLFLISAPQPDSQTVAEMTQNFVVPSKEHQLRAADSVDAFGGDEGIRHRGVSLSTHQVKVNDQPLG